MHGNIQDLASREQTQARQSDKILIILFACIGSTRILCKFKHVYKITWNMCLTLYIQKFIRWWEQNAILFIIDPVGIESVGRAIFDPDKVSFLCLKLTSWQKTTAERHLKSRIWRFWHTFDLQTVDTADRAVCQLESDLKGYPILSGLVPDVNGLKTVESKPCPNRRLLQKNIFTWHAH